MRTGNKYSIELIKLIPIVAEAIYWESQATNGELAEVGGDNGTGILCKFNYPKGLNIR